MSKELRLPSLRCLRCGHTWIPRKAQTPKWCPKCNSPYWNRLKWKGLSRTGPQTIWGVAHLRGSCDLQAKAVLRKARFVLLHDIAIKHRDDALQVDGKNMREEIEHSMISMLFAYTCLEAFINAIAADRTDLSFGKKTGIESKLVSVSEHLATRKHGRRLSPFNKSSQLLESLRALTRSRIDLVHWDAQFADVVTTKYGNTERTIETFNASQAASACRTVKDIIITVVGNMDDPPEVNWLE